jgi:hypothetical protein
MTAKLTLFISTRAISQAVVKTHHTTFAIGWKGRYRIEGPAFIYVDHDTGQLSTILGYPTHQLK